MPDVRILPATTENSALVSHILAESFAEFKSYYTSRAYTATTPGTAEVNWRIREGSVWLARWHGKWVGTAATTPHARRTLYIRGMAVLPSARRTGVAWSLLQHIESVAISEGYQRLLLSTTPFLKGAIRLYERFGFHRSHEGPTNLFGTPLFSMKKVIPIFRTNAREGVAARNNGSPMDRRRTGSTGRESRALTSDSNSDPPVSGFKIRGATSRDIDTLIHQRHMMWEDIYGEPIQGSEAADEEYRAWSLRMMKSGLLKGFLIEVAGVVVAGGCVWLREEQPRPGLPSGKGSYLLSMYTEPDFRRRGLAKAIVREAILWSKKNGYKRITLHASKMGRRLYSSMGWKRTWEMGLNLE